MIRKLLFFVFLTLTTQLSFAQAPGNTCATATPLTLVPGATISTGLQSNAGTGDDYIVGSYNSCVNTFYGDGQDGVYSIDVVIPGNYVFAFTNTGADGDWKSVSVHSETLPTCVINSGNCEGGLATDFDRDGSVIINLLAGTYFVVVDSWAAFTPAADFELLITTPIDNSDCSGATPINSTVACQYNTYTTLDATDSGVADPGCANYAGGDVWFSYVVNSTGELTVEVDGVDDDFNPGVAVYTGTCGALGLISCDDNSGTGNDAYLNITGRTPGETLLIRVWEFGNTTTLLDFSFNLCVSTPVPVGTNGVFLDCPGETALEMTSDIGLTCGVIVGTTSLGNSISGNLNGQPTANRPFSSSNSTNCAFNGGAVRRYQQLNFTVTVTGTYTFTMTSAPFDSMGYIVVNDGLFVPGSCATGTFVIGDDDSGGFPNPQLTISLTAGTNYTLITTEWSLNAGAFPYTWTVSFPVSTPDPEWYDSAVGGTLLGSGGGFNPVGVAGSGLTDTNTPGIYPFWVECPLNPGVRTPVNYVIGKFWDGDTNSDWDTASNWTNDELPTDSQCIYIQAGTGNDPIIADNDNGDGLNITIETGATLTLASDVDANNFGSSLTIVDHIDIQGTGSLIVQDDASLIQVNDTPATANSGDITLNRNTDIRRSDYVYWSSPVQNYNVSDIYGANTPLSYIYEWTPTIATGSNAPGVLPTGGMPICYGSWALNSSATMELGKGYIVRGPSNFTSAIATATSVFTGVPNNGVITQPISSGNNSFAYSNYSYNPYGTGVLTVTPFDDNWNLLGNPYPSALDAQTFLTDPSNNIIEGAVHIWTHGTQIGSNGDSFYDDYDLTYSSNDYVTYNFSGTNTYFDETFGGKIASGQGFFVLALNDNEAGNVTFNNSMRDRSHSNTAFYRNADPNQNISDSNEIERNRIWLNLVGQSGDISSILVGYIEGATQDKDRLYDAYVREVNNLSLYSKIDDQRMIIQGRSLPFNENDQVPLGAVIPSAGEYTIAISNVDGLFLNDNQNIYLEDLHKGIIHNLRATPYTFTETEAIDYDERFVLRYTDDALSIEDFEKSSLSIIAPKGEYIKISSDSSPIDTVIVYDLLGRALLQESLINKNEFVFNNYGLSSGTYIVKVSLESGQSNTQKVILKE